VRCFINPKTCFERAIIEGTIDAELPHLSSYLAVEPASFGYTRQFTQIGLTGAIHPIIGWNSDENRVESKLMNIIPVATSSRVIECHANCAGFQYTKECGDELRNFFAVNPFVVMGQKLIMQPFNSGPTKNGFSGTTCNLTLNMTTDFLLLFPKYAQQLTCFENPMYQNFQLVVANRRFPDKTVTTFGPVFYQLQLDASDFDSMFPASEEYEDSLTVRKNNETMILKPYTDTTSFNICFQCERSGADEIFFDGMDSKGSIVSAQLFGNPIHPNADVYYSDSAKPPPPILFTNQDTIWAFSSVNDGSCDYFTTYQGAIMFTKSVA
jgi:hypothetical protein